MSEKEKPKRNQRMGFLRSCLIFALYPLLILTVFGIGMVYWAIGGYVKPSLDPQHIPTAEYLLEHPIEEPIWTVEPLGYMSSSAEYSLRVNWAFVNNSGNICFGVSSSYTEDFDNLCWAEIIINEQFISRFNPTWPNFVWETNPANTQICLQDSLDTGLHIIEFRAKESLFAEPYYIHRWAIEIP